MKRAVLGLAALVALSSPVHALAQEDPPPDPEAPTEASESETEEVTAAQALAVAERAQADADAAQAAADAAADAASVAGEETDQEDRLQDFRDEVDRVFEIPSSPAQVALGASTDAVQRPGTLRDLVAAVSTALGPDGLQPGVSLEVAPLALADRDTHLENSGRVADSLRLSLATAEVDDNPGRTTVAFGFRLSLQDPTNYRRNSEARRETRLALLPTAGPACSTDRVPLIPGDDESVQELTPEQRAEQARLCSLSSTDQAAERQAHFEAAMNALRTGWRIELAGAWALDAGDLLSNDSDMRYRQLRLWAAAERLDPNGSTLGFTLAFKQTRLEPVSTRDFSLTVGARAGYMGSSFGFSVQGLYELVREEDDAGQHETVNLLRFGGDLSVRPVGGEGGRIGILLTYNPEEESISGQITGGAEFGSAPVTSSDNGS